MTGLFNTRQPGFRFSRLPCVIKVAACLLVLVGVSACEGDPELFEEGVLSNQLQIRTLSISAQGEGAAPLAINPGRQLNFVVSGTNTTGEAIELASSGRRWVSSNPAAGSISDSGRFVALENGVTDVSVLIAGIESARFRVQVSAANLVGVSEIIGPAQVSSCSRPEYTARGSFDDSSTRFIRNITWNIDAPSNDGRNNFDTDIHLNGPERALVNARGPQTVTLIASQDGYSRSFEVEIVDDLGSLRIEGVPNELAHGQTVSLRALAGSEADPEAEQQRRDVTDIAFWQVTAAEVIATVTNDNVAGDDSGGGRMEWPGRSLLRKPECQCSTAGGRHSIQQFSCHSFGRSNHRARTFGHFHSECSARW